MFTVKDILEFCLSRYGIYPLTAFALSQPPPPKTRAVTPIEDTNGPGSNKSETPDLLEPEDRWGIEFKCYIGPPVPQDPNQLTLLTKLCDGMNRQMQAPLQLTGIYTILLIVIAIIVVY